MGVGLFVVVVYHRKITPTQLWVELSWVVAKKENNVLCTGCPIVIRFTP